MPSRRSRACSTRACRSSGSASGTSCWRSRSARKTYKLSRGHRGANQPVKDLETGKVEITSQNHGFAVDPKTLPANARVTHVSLFDGTNEGIAATDRPAFSRAVPPGGEPRPVGQPPPVPSLRRDDRGAQGRRVKRPRQGGHGMFDLSGRVALVTGGNGGIGLGFARGLAKAGATRDGGRAQRGEERGRGGGAGRARRAGADRSRWTSPTRRRSAPWSRPRPSASGGSTSW